jgi:hypothetical protein
LKPQLSRNLTMNRLKNSCLPRFETFSALSALKIIVRTI